MKSAKHGSDASGAELANVSGNGIWLLVDAREFFLPFDRFPWFREASIRELANIHRPREGHLRWPDLDVDLTLASIEDPDAYPLVSRLSGRPTPPKRPEDHG